MVNQSSDVKDCFSEKFPSLLISHYEHLKSSAISDEVIKERGCETIFGTAKLEYLSFAKSQRRHPGILFPIHTINGKVGGYQYRPDHPREQIKPNGQVRKVKYETPAGSDIQIDVPTRCRESLANPSIPVYFTEGIKKVDSLASAGACAIGLVGVWGFKGKNVFGGTVINADLDAIAWNGRIVKLVFDSDFISNPQVAKALERLSTILSRKGASRIDIIQLPSNDDGTKNGVDDFLAKGHTLADLDKLIVNPNVVESATKRKSHGGKLVIECYDKQLPTTRQAILESLYADDKIQPKMFVRNAILTTIVLTEDRRPFIEDVTEYQLRGYMSDTADYIKVTSFGEVSIIPPLEYVRDIMALRSWNFNPIVNIIETPTIRPDGTILNKPGYDNQTKLFLFLNSSTVSVINENPTNEEFKNAITWLKDVLWDFPFDTKASAATAMSAIITPIIRPMINGNIPLHVFDKPQAGTGATLLSEVVSLITTGKRAPIMTLPDNEEEIRKKITSVLKSGQGVVVIDNVDHPLESSALAAVLTSDTWQDRILGQNKDIILPNRAIWIATGNNITLRGDLPRRSIWSRLDAQINRPWLRDTKFKHSNLIQWVEENRTKIISAILTIVRHWIIAGKPAPEKYTSLGGFESYSKNMASILHHIGINDFLGNIQKVYDEIDRDTPEWEVFLEIWHTTLNEQPITVGELKEQLNIKSSELRKALPEAIADIEVKNYTRILGNTLSKKRDMRFSNGFVLVKAGEKDRYVKWNVIKPKQDSYTFSFKNESNEFDTPLTQRSTDNVKNTHIYIDIGARGVKDSSNSSLASKMDESPSEIPPGSDF